MRRVLLRLMNVMGPARAEREAEREIEAHLALIKEDFQARGMTEAEAQRRARLSLGGLQQVKERHGDARTIVWLDDARRDAGYGIRVLRRNPIFALTATASLAIGIGATATIFGAANALLLRTAPGVSEPDRLVEITETNGSFGIHPMSYPNLLDVRDRATTLEGVFGYDLNLRPMSLRVQGDAGAEAIFGDVVTMNYFTVLGVRAAIGRVFGAEDSERLDASPIVVLSDRFWERRFAKNSSVVGQTLRLNDHAFTIVGVAASDFHGTTVGSPDVWVPAGETPFVDRGYDAREFGWGLAGARLKPGVSVGHAAAEMNALARALARDYPAENRGLTLGVSRSSPIPAGLRLLVAGFLTFLMMLVSVVLAIACANVAGVLLARAAARRREMAIRLAIGAGRGRLVRQLLVETMVLFAVACAAGLWLAHGMTALLLSTLPAFPIPVDVSLPLDGRVTAFTIGVSLVTSLLSGLAPALHASKANVVDALKDGVQGAAERLRARHGFVVGQVAFSVLLVVTAGLLVRALGRASSVDQGFDPHGVEAVTLDLTLGGYTRESGPLFVRDLVGRVRELPGVQAAAAAFAAPNDRLTGFSLSIPGRTSPRGESSVQAVGNIVTPGFFATTRIEIVAGRDFNSDDGSARPVVIVGESAARQFWPGARVQDVLGREIVWNPFIDRSGQTAPPHAAFAGTTLTVVGVARDLRSSDAGDVRPFVYIPFQQQYSPDVTLLARTVHGERVANDLRTLIARMNPNLPIVSDRTLEEQTGPVVVQLRVAAAIAASVGAVGLLLAGIGIYGVTAYAVARRAREIGIRVAVGARRADVMALVIGEAMSLVAVGAGAGLLLASGVGHLLGRFLYGVPPLDPLTFASSALLFIAVGLIACYVPVRRAMRISAMEALRCD